MAAATRYLVKGNNRVVVNVTGMGALPLRLSELTKLHGLLVPKSTTYYWSGNTQQTTLLTTSRVKAIWTTVPTGVRTILVQQVLLETSFSLL
jgi:hypothetical protein